MIVFSMFLICIGISCLFFYAYLTGHRDGAEWERNRRDRRVAMDRSPDWVRRETETFNAEDEE